MKSVRIKLSDEQKKQLAKIEKRIAKLKHSSYAVFAQIRFPDGEAAVVLVTGRDCYDIHAILKEAAK